MFTDTNSSWLIFESIKALEIKTSTVIDLIFGSNTISSCVFFFFLIIDLYFLISAVIASIFMIAVELKEYYCRGVPTKEAKEEIGIHPVTVEAKITKCSV